jgi:hypothetical protein
MNFATLWDTERRAIDPERAQPLPVTHGRVLSVTRHERPEQSYKDRSAIAKREREQRRQGAA